MPSSRKQALRFLGVGLVRLRGAREPVPEVVMHGRAVRAAAAVALTNDGQVFLREARERHVVDVRRVHAREEVRVIAGQQLRRLAVLLQERLALERDALIDFSFCLRSHHAHRPFIALAPLGPHAAGVDERVRLKVFL